MINTNLQQRGVLGIGALFLALVVFTFFYTLLQWRNDWILAHQPEESLPPIARTTDIENSIANIPNAHLFGKSPETGKVTDVPISSLQLQVTGIVKLNNQSKASKVFISTSGQPSKIYKIGDNVASGVKVYDITVDTVIFDNNGRLEKLPLVREKLQFKPHTREGL